MMDYQSINHFQHLYVYNNTDSYLQYSVVLVYYTDMLLAYLWPMGFMA